MQTSTIKADATRLRSAITTMFGIPVSRSQSMELIAHAKNFPNWDAAAASATNQSAINNKAPEPIAINWHSPSTAATQICQLLPAGPDGNAGQPFGAFAWKTVFNILTAMNALSIRPSFKSLLGYLVEGVDPLVRSLFGKLLMREYGNMDSSSPEGQQARQFLMERTDSGATHSLADLIEKFQREGREFDNTLGGIIGVFNHEKKHFNWMIQGLVETLERLAASELANAFASTDLPTLVVGWIRYIITQPQIMQTLRHDAEGRILVPPAAFVGIGVAPRMIVDLLKKHQLIINTDNGMATLHSSLTAIISARERAKANGCGQ